MSKFQGESYWQSWDFWIDICRKKRWYLILIIIMYGETYFQQGIDEQIGEWNFNQQYLV